MIKIILSGEIGWDIYPEDIREQLDQANGEDLEVHVASPGGGVIRGIEIYNMFRDYKRDYPNSQIMVIIKGMAASMASYIVMNPAFDLVAAEDNAVFMIHNASGGTYGDYKEMNLFAKILEGLTNIIGLAYTKKTKKNIKEIREMMDNETWLFGNEIMEAGFVDEMVDSGSKKNKSKNEAITNAKKTYSNLYKKINESENKIDINKVAAMIKSEPDPRKAIEEIREMNNENNLELEQSTETPAQRENNKTEVTTMNLEQFLAENPAAKIEFDKHLDDKFKAGEIAGQDVMQKRMKAAAVFLAPDTEYPATVKSIAIDVLNGEKTVDSLQTTAAAFDALREASNSDSAADESADIGDTTGEQTPKVTEDGVINNEEDFASEVARSKKNLGMEV
jgi:ATP-dependent protease ClpP protease subunit